MIFVKCRCGNPIIMPDEWANRRVSCRQCHGVILVPPKDGASAPPPPAPAAAPPANDLETLSAAAAPALGGHPAPRRAPQKIQKVQKIATPQPENVEYAEIDEASPERIKAPRPRKLASGMSFETRISLYAVGVVAVGILGLLAWFLVIRDSWEQDHRADLMLMSEQAVVMFRAGRVDDGLRKFDEVQHLVGQRKLSDSSLAQAVANASAAAVDARKVVAARTPPVPVAVKSPEVAVVTPTPTPPTPTVPDTPATAPVVAVVTPTPDPVVVPVPVPVVAAPTQTLADARKDFKTVLTKKTHSGEVAPLPPTGTFTLVTYPAPLGDNVAYLTVDPKDGKKHPAIVWITGGDCNTIGDVWTPMPANNDQIVSAFRKAGLVVLFPSLRGGNKNPGFREGFYGEVDDVVAAGEFLRKQPWVDPERVYLGGHSTGGTLALLTAEFTDKFRVTFAFGPTNDPSGYTADYRPPVDLSIPLEGKLRAPGNWLDSVRTPTFILEGRATGQTNITSLTAMDSLNKNSKNTFIGVDGADHFTTLGPITKLIADKILADTGPAPNITLTEQETGKLFAK